MMRVNIVLVSLLLFMSGCLGLKEDANMSSCIEKERQALLDVKANLIALHGGEVLSNWGSQDCCNWVGVSCNHKTGHVIKLNLGLAVRVDDLTLYGPRVTGKISPSLQVLNRLEDLHLDSIDFQSNPLPNFLASMSKLQVLDVSGANLSGPIPFHLANLSNLLFLDLSRNSFVGTIPFSFGDLTSLTYLYLSQNLLGGFIPKSFGNISSLVELDLSQNLLSGSLPSFVGCSSLITLSLDHNSLNGSMPDFTRCTSLQFLNLSSNILSGNMAKSVGPLPNLGYLNVGHNSFTGSIPNFIGCPSLSILDMSSNYLSGNVPKSLGQVSSLVSLDLSSNSLEGVISEIHFLNLTLLSDLDLSFNSLALDLSVHGRIASLELSTIKLRSCKLGPRFPVWIKTQKHFMHLDISNAGISDRVPDWFWDLPHELNFLNISSNKIEGMLPDMTYIFDGYPGMDLSNNHFNGRVPSFPISLSALNLSGNRFSGALSFLCNFDSSLTFLDLSNNSLSGSLPDCWMRFQEKLVILNLSNNNLSGEIPSSLGNLDKLEALYLRANTFVGQVPLSLRNCTRLRFVDLGDNKLSGIIPEWIGEELSELYVLVLGSNRFNGSLPSQLCWLYNLQVLDVSNNELSGSIPRCFDNFTAMTRKSFGDDTSKHSYYSFVGPILHVTLRCFSLPCLPLQSREEAHFSDNALVRWKGKERSFERSGLQLLKSIDLSRNNLTGILPNEITGLYDLASLNLSTNKLHGDLPKDMGRLKSLQSLDLSTNEFSGQIPWSLAQLTFLGYLDLSYNNLSGRIPTGTQLQGFNYTSYSGNPQLCGPPLPLCGFPPIVEKKDVEENEDDFWKSYYTGMGAGFGVGFLGFCGVLTLNRSWRYFFFAWLSHMKNWIYVIVAVHIGKLKRNFRS